MLLYHFVAVYYNKVMDSSTSYKQARFRSLRFGDHKPNIVIIQAFPANRTLSAGIIEYLSDFFNVHFIDLPGFHPDLKPLENPTIEKYTQFANKKIRELNLDKFVLAGISFGFLIATKVAVNKDNCLAILGSGPYLGHIYVRFPKGKKLLLRISLKILDKTRIGEKIWYSNTFKKVLTHFLGKKSKAIVDTIVMEVNPEAFFKTASMILTYDEKPNFKKGIPHVLLMNPRDTAIDFYKTLETLIDYIDINKLRVIITRVEHYPKNPTYEYFKEAFTPNEIESLFNFVEFSNGITTSQLTE